jgi:hypothetical protein
MPLIKRRNKKTGNIVQFEWSSDQPPKDSDIEAIENAQSGKGEKIESRGLLDDIKEFFTGPIPQLKEQGDKLSNIITGQDPGSELGPIEQFFYNASTSIPSVGLLPEESNTESRAKFRGGIGGAIEGLSQIPSMSDVVTLGLSGAGKGALSAPSKIAKGIDLIGGGVTAGAGIGDIIGGIKDEDAAAIAQGALRTALGSAGVAANKNILPDIDELIPNVHVRMGNEPSILAPEEFPPIDPLEEAPNIVKLARENARANELPNDRSTYNDAIASIRNQRSPMVPLGKARRMSLPNIQKGYDTGELPSGELVDIESILDPQLTIGDVNISERGAIGKSPLADISKLDDEQLSNEMEIWKNHFANEYPTANPEKASIISTRLGQIEDEIARRSDPANKLVNLINQAKPVRREQASSLKTQRASRASKLRDIQSNIQGEEAVNLSKAILSDEYDKPTFSPNRDKLSKEDVSSLFQRVNESNDLDVFQKVRTGIALQKLLDDDITEVPQMNELELLGKVFGNDLSQALLKRRSMGKKVGDFLSDVASVPRALASSLDLSAPLRQGKILSLSNPSIAVKAFGDQLKAFGSEKYFKAIETDIFSRPNAQLYEDSGLYLARKHTVNRSAKEEIFQSNLAEKIPGVLASERAYVTFLNKLRADVFDKQVDSFSKMGITPDANPKVFKGLADWINISTGRGSLGRLEKLSGPLTTIFFSPKFQASRLALINPATYIKLPTPIRKMALTNMAVMFGAQTALLSLLSLRNDVDIETDARSSDFGKIRKGESRLDPWVGLQPWARLIAQLRLDKAILGELTPIPTEGAEYKAERKSPNTGDITNPTRYSLIENFSRNKLAPLPAAIIDIFKEKTVSGKDTTWASTMAHFIPIIFGDIESMLDYSGDEYKGIPIPSGIREDVAPEMLIPAILGEGVTTYDQK